tara:strand:+ start:351 stop:857 length:507 start_codon:yes stop_codon:yes gene_type:complete
MDFRIALSASQTACVGLIGVFAFIVALNNIFDYQSNFLFVQHVLTMDTTFHDNKLMYRAINSAPLHHAAYAVIIALEAIVGLISLFAAGSMCAALCARDMTRFCNAKGLAVIGLTIGFILWFGGFMIVGAEWFLMWQSQTWNGQSAAFRFCAIILGTLVFLSSYHEAS